jgi:hypothetical protein
MLTPSLTPSLQAIRKKKKEKEKKKRKRKRGNAANGWKGKVKKM